MNITNIVLTLITCMSTNAPLLRHWGLGLGCPVCLVLTEGLGIDPILEFWDIKGKMITAATPAKVYQKIIGAGDHFPVILYYGDVTTAETATRFSMLEEAENTGKTRSGPFRATALIAVKDHVPDAIRERVFPIIIGKPPDHVADYGALVPDQRDLPQIFSQVMRFTEDTPVERFFRCILQFLNFSLLGHEYEMYCDYANEIIRLINDFYEVRDPRMVEERFIENLFAWVKEERFHELYEICEVPSDKDVNRIMIYDRRYLYIGRDVFNEITSDMNITADRLKYLLASTNPPVLVRQEKGCYTSRVSIGTGEYNRPRMLRFDLARINRGRGGEYVTKGLLPFEMLYGRRNTIWQTT